MNFVKIINYYSKLFTGVLTQTAASPAASSCASLARVWRRDPSSRFRHSAESRSSRVDTCDPRASGSPDTAAPKTCQPKLAPVCPSAARESV